jgi:hypothetical protein
VNAQVQKTAQPDRPDADHRRHRHRPQV